MIIYPLSKIYSDNLKHPYPVSGVGGGKPIDPTELVNLLSFKAISADTVMTINIPNQCSIDELKYTYGTKWIKANTQTGANHFNIPVGKTIYLKANGLNNNNSSQFINITHSNEVIVGGDITSLLNGVGGDYALTKTSQFNSLFKNNTNIKNTPNMPSTTISNSCYSSMYYGCTGLTSISPLPATTTKYGCYSSMYYGCTGLTSLQANYLPAQHVENTAYRQMFSGSGVQTIDDNFMLSKTYGEWALYQMFSDCPNLTSVDFELTMNSTSTNSCASIFSNDISLTKAPKIICNSHPSVNFSCATIYDGCSNLSDVYIDIPGTWNANVWQAWLRNVASSGVLHNLGGATGIPNNASGYPSGWTLSVN